MDFQQKRADRQGGLESLQNGYALPPWDTGLSDKALKHTVRWTTIGATMHAERSLFCKSLVMPTTRGMGEMIDAESTDAWIDCYSCMRANHCERH
jgi:hypothetical protein